ncbi:hypothetical protein N9R11_02355 [Polaribacter sp.]|nr:hypothetical protein [Polaribacter sp.]MDA9363027.1 hypothetical protein [Polaribacter sp.]MDC1354146.1 hypothetical protein [Polaribacter sp.]
MIFSKIKKYFLQKEIQQSSKTSKRVVANNKVKNIGIVSTMELNNVYEFEQKVKKLFPKHRSVNWYLFREFHKGDEKSFHHFSNNDFNWRGKINDVSLQIFVDTPFDLLICYFDKNHVFLESLVKQSQANFKIGFSNVNQSLFDLEISERIDNIDSFHAEVEKYLQILGSIEAS